MVVRVIAGDLKGRRLETPNWPGLRPTADRVRETLFNLLGRLVEDARVLDACAGTGALGLEALSRGATQAVFVDCDRRATTLIAANVTRCDVDKRTVVVRGALPDVLTHDDLATTFDIILFDPPYDQAGIGAILSSLGGHLRESGVLVLERSKRVVVEDLGALTLVRTVKTGDSALDFFHRTVAPKTAR